MVSYGGVRGKTKQHKKTRISPGDIKYVPDGVGCVYYGVVRVIVCQKKIGEKWGVHKRNGWLMSVLK